nr:hypothetical protein [Spirirestis rafaelensis WJT71-NPBG6]
MEYVFQRHSSQLELGAKMDELESKIVEILKRGTPLRAVKIADMLGVERREVNHYLYSSLKHLVVQDSDYRWSFKTNQRSNIENLPTQPRTPKTQSSQPARQENLYSFRTYATGIKREWADRANTSEHDKRGGSARDLRFKAFSQTGDR